MPADMRLTLVIMRWRRKAISARAASGDFQTNFGEGALDYAKAIQNVLSPAWELLRVTIMPLAGRTLAYCGVPACRL